MLTVTVDPHPLLDLHASVTEFPGGLGPTPASLTSLLALDATAPIHGGDKVREAVRRLLRHGGFKPSGRSKPASEYLVRAISEGALASINAAGMPQRPKPPEWIIMPSRSTPASAASALG